MDRIAKITQQIHHCFYNLITDMIVQVNNISDIVGAEQ